MQSNYIEIVIRTTDNIHCRHIISQAEIEAFADEEAPAKALIQCLTDMREQLLLYRERRDNQQSTINNGGNCP